MLLVANAVGGFIVWKLKSYKDRATAAERRGDAIVKAVDDALADGDVSKAEIGRIVRAAKGAN